MLLKRCLFDVSSKTVEIDGGRVFIQVGRSVLNLIEFIEFKPSKAYPQFHLVGTLERGRERSKPGSRAMRLKGTNWSDSIILN